MPAWRHPFEDNWTGGPHLGDPTDEVQGIGAGVAEPSEVTAHSPNTVWWRVGRLTGRMDELGEVALDSYLRSTCACVAIFSLNGAVSSWGCEGLCPPGTLMRQ